MSIHIKFLDTASEFYLQELVNTEIDYVQTRGCTIQSIVVQPMTRDGYHRFLLTITYRR